jgi:hypothetical protein
MSILQPAIYVTSLAAVPLPLGDLFAVVGDLQALVGDLLAVGDLQALSMVKQNATTITAFL